MFKRIFLFLTLALVVTTGCAPTLTPGPTATLAPPQPVDVSRAGGFAAYVPVPVDVAPG